MHTKIIGDVTIHHSSDWSGIAFVDYGSETDRTSIELPGRVALAIGLAAFGKELYVKMEGIADRLYGEFLDRIEKLGRKP